MKRVALASLLAVGLLTPAVVEAGLFRMFRPRATAVCPAPQPAAAGSQYQSFSYEPTEAAPAPTYRPQPAARSSTPAYLRPNFKFHGRYAP